MVENCEDIVRLDAKDPEHWSLIGDLLSTHGDPVHPFLRAHPEKAVGMEDISAFQSQRMGELSENKQTWVTLRPRMTSHFNDIVPLRPESPALTVKASLYTYIQTNKIADERDLIGNIDHILSAPVQDLDSAPTAVIFYSVASFVKPRNGEGQDIINRAHEQFADANIWLSTLSPLRGFAGWLGEKVGTDEKNRLYSALPELKRHALLYLLTQRNQVQKFHTQTMGAYIGDIKMNCNHPNTPDYEEGMGVMVNYVYPNDVTRSYNRNVFKTKQLVVAPHLYNDFTSLGCEGFVQIPHSEPSRPFVIKPAMF